MEDTKFITIETTQLQLMENLNISVENTNVKRAFEILIDNYKDQFAVFLNNVLKSEGGSADVFIDKDEEGVFRVWQSAPDKGHVLAQLNGQVQLAEYKSLANDTKYVLYDGQRLALFLKEPEGTPDSKVGHFLNLNEVVAQIDSDSVKEAIEKVRVAKVNAEVVEKKIAKAVKKAESKLKKA